ncbi:MAG: hypothetical protein ACREBR_02655 [bacterium]
MEREREIREGRRRLERELERERDRELGEGEGMRWRLERERERGEGAKQCPEVNASLDLSGLLSKRNVSECVCCFTYPCLPPSVVVCFRCLYMKSIK